MYRQNATEYPLTILSEVHENVKGNVDPLQISYQIHRLTTATKSTEYAPHLLILENWTQGLKKKLIRVIKKKLPEATAADLSAFKQALDPLEIHERKQHRTLIHEIELKIQEAET